FAGRAGAGGEHLTWGRAGPPERAGRTPGADTAGRLRPYYRARLPRVERRLESRCERLAAGPRAAAADRHRVPDRLAVFGQDPRAAGAAGRSAACLATTLVAGRLAARLFPAGGGRRGFEVRPAHAGGGHVPQGTGVVRQLIRRAAVPCQRLSKRARRS